MRRRKMLLALGAATCLLVLLAAHYVWSPDYEAVAERLVTQSAVIQEGDKVLIEGSTRDVELLENLAVHVRKQGAFPMVMLDTDRMTRRMFTDVPEAYDTQSPDLALAMVEILDAVISISANETPDLLADIPPERFAKRSKAFEQVGKRLRERGVKQVNLGNDLYPTQALADQFGVSQDELADIFWSGVNADYEAIQSTGDRLQRLLAGGNELHLTHPNGTDLRLQISDRDAYVSDGMISEADVARGGAALQVWLPAGEVYLAPVPGTAEGTVVIDHHFFQGGEIENLRLTFEQGKMTSMTADAGLEALQQHYDAATGDKDGFAVIDVGLNPNVRIVPESKMVAWMPAGMVTIGVGNNEWAGGENNAGFAFFGHVPGSTLTMDGTAIVENGELRVPAAGMKAGGG